MLSDLNNKPIDLATTPQSVAARYKVSEWHPELKTYAIRWRGVCDYPLPEDRVEALFEKPPQPQGDHAPHYTPVELAELVRRSRIARDDDDTPLKPAELARRARIARDAYDALIAYLKEPWDVLPVEVNPFVARMASGEKPPRKPRIEDLSRIPNVVRVLVEDYGLTFSQNAASSHRNSACAIVAEFVGISPDSVRTACERYWKSMGISLGSVGF